MVFSPGMLVRSKKGRDKGCIYVIINVNAEYVYLADGRNRPVCRTKRKNKKHLQVIKKTVCKSYADNEAVKKVISMYSRLDTNENSKVPNVQED